MNTTLTPTAPDLREALYALSIAKDVPDANLLDDVVRRYPQFADQLTGFAIALALDALQGDAAFEAAEVALDPTVASPAVVRAMSRFQNRLHAETRDQRRATGSERASASEPYNPFATLSREEFRAFARRLNVNNVFVAKLRDRQVDPDTLTPGFHQRVADDLTAPLEVVIAHFAARKSPSTHAQFFKAEGSPTDGGCQTFEEAVRNSGLSEAQQHALLAL
jgi:hypothetical protein